jgi:hypothetical protein
MMADVTDGPSPLARLADGRRVSMVNVNRRVYDLFEHAFRGAIDDWRFQNRHGEVEVRDAVLFRIGEPSAGLYAAGEIVEPPREMAGSGGEPVAWRAMLKYECAIDPPALREELLAARSLPASPRFAACRAPTSWCRPSSSTG